MNNKFEISITINLKYCISCYVMTRATRKISNCLYQRAVQDEISACTIAGSKAGRSSKIADRTIIEHRRCKRLVAIAQFEFLKRWLSI